MYTSTMSSGQLCPNASTGVPNNGMRNTGGEPRGRRRCPRRYQRYLRDDGLGTGTAFSTEMRETSTPPWRREARRRRNEAAVSAHGYSLVRHFTRFEPAHSLPRWRPGRSLPFSDAAQNSVPKRCTGISRRWCVANRCAARPKYRYDCPRSRLRRLARGAWRQSHPRCVFGRPEAAMDQICFTCSIAPDAAEHSALAAEHTQTTHADTGHAHHTLPQARYRPASASNVWHNAMCMCVCRSGAQQRAAPPHRAAAPRLLRSPCPPPSPTPPRSRSRTRCRPPHRPPHRPTPPHSHHALTLLSPHRGIVDIVLGIRRRVGLLAVGAILLNIIYIYTNMYIHIYIYTHTHTHIYIYIIYIYIYIYIYIKKYKNINIYI